MVNSTPHRSTEKRNISVKATAVLIFSESLRFWFEILLDRCGLDRAVVERVVVERLGDGQIYTPATGAVPLSFHAVTSEKQFCSASPVRMRSWQSKSLKNFRALCRRRFRSFQG